MSEERDDIELTEQTIKEAMNQSIELNRAIDRLKRANAARVNNLDLEQLKRLSS